MQVKLISYSTPVQELYTQGITDVQELVAYCARVSNPTNQFNTETSDKLIQYLIRHKHWSPLEMASACLEIETTRDIARQILRHRSFSFQEFSQRYANLESLGNQFEIRKLRLQDSKNRQNSLEPDLSDPDMKDAADMWDEYQKRVIDLSTRIYKWAIIKGVAKEQARAVLPEGLTKTRMYMNGTLRSWVHYIELRSANGTQKEHMEIARECARILASILPLLQTKTPET